MKCLIFSTTIIFCYICFTLAQTCFRRECKVNGKVGCKNSVKVNFLNEDDCCKYDGAFGFAESMRRVGRESGCYVCKRCDDVLSTRDGQWGRWSRWSECSKTCGEGIMFRTRQCDFPTPSKLGKNCEGNNMETAFCFEKTCPVHGGWSRWSDYSTCSKSCGEGEKFRSRTCSNPQPLHGGNFCTGVPRQRVKCFLINCPIDGGWSAWSSWSKCSKTCGGGIKVQYHACDNPLPRFGGKTCSGRSWNEMSCNLNPCPIHGQWSAWSIPSACVFEYCNDLTRGGWQTRSRTCTNPLPKFNGKMSEGKFFDTGFCIDSDNCRRVGEWSEWGLWDCSETGVHQNRTCLRIQFGGKDCSGTNLQLKSKHDGSNCDYCRSNCVLNSKGIWTPKVTDTLNPTEEPEEPNCEFGSDSGSGCGSESVSGFGFVSGSESGTGFRSPGFEDIEN